MVTLDWTWRSADELPTTALLVVGRTAYGESGWRAYGDMLVPSYYRLLGDPNVLGIAVRTDERERVAWSVTAWASYEALEACVRRQVAWLTDVAQRANIGGQLRHNAYRTVNTKDLPPSWAEVETMVLSVMTASPLGADAFPELSKALGIVNGDPRA